VVGDVNRFYSSAGSDEILIQTQPTSTQEWTKYWKKPKAAYCYKLASFSGERVKLVETAKRKLTGRLIQLNRGFERTIYTGNRNKDTKDQSLMARTGLPLQQTEFQEYYRNK
jgi:hypothetical protein